MRVLLFGGTTFVSRYFVKRLVEEGHDVTTVTRGNRKGLHGNGVKEIYCDRGDGEKLKNSLDGIEFDYVVDVSGYTRSDVEKSYEAVKDRKIEGYLFISSSAVYMESEILPIKEYFRMGENKFWGKYGTDKLEAEIFFMEKFDSEGFPVVMVRPPYIYGEWNNVYREAFIFDRLKEGKPVVIPGKGKTLVQFIHIEDLFLTAEKIMAAGIKGSVLNVGNSEAITFRGWALKCMEAYGSETGIVEFDYEGHGYGSRDFFPFHDYQYFLDTDEVEKLYIPQMRLEEGLRRALEWYRENEGEVNKRSHYFENCERILEKNHELHEWKKQ